ncbi:hypothetical protein jhhlp_007902 [Lomentospora prolificans]|uniref:Heterokaryon incompatibility domain-containing protein n=1 Tax=Lomentospora prolificans TaxID=41688 RepID=A0A2N3N0W2_9PEZI|nr:hypothetical protein jhhlp_007902 [Lomentospora prolificans]
MRTVPLTVDHLILDPKDNRPKIEATINFDDYLTIKPDEERFKVVEPEPRLRDRLAEKLKGRGRDAEANGRKPRDGDIISGPGIEGFAPDMLSVIIGEMRVGEGVEMHGDGMFASDDVKARGRQVRPVIVPPQGEPAYRDRFDWGKKHGPMSGNYVALSYCWGDPSNMPEILIDGQSVKVTRNLEAGLRRFREMKIFQEGLWIWIDAICINQGDENEVISQLELMGNIYRQAGNVVIWLGEIETPDREELAWSAISLLHDISRHYRTEFESAMDRHHNPDVINAFRKRAKLQLQAARKLWIRGQGQQIPDPNRPDQIAGIHDFFSRHYWRRLWVIQELAATHPGAPVVYGRFVTQWRFVRDATYLLKDIEDKIREMVPAALERCGIVAPSDYSFAHVASIADLARLSFLERRISAEYVRQVGEEQPLENIGSRFGLRMALNLAAGAGCTVPRDRVYGLLGISALPHLGITPTAGKTTEEVFKEFARACYKKDWPLTILSFLDGSGGGGKYKLPSWCPNFDRDPDAALHPLEGKWHANWSRIHHTPAQRSLVWGDVEFADDDPNELYFAAYVVDTIEGLGAVSPLDAPYHDFGHDFEAGVFQPAIAELNTAAGAADEVIYNTLVGGTKLGGDSAPESFRSLLTAFTGLAPVAAQKGDKVIVMHSHTVPLILRASSESGWNVRGHLVGEAYVSGLMNGEALEKQRAAQDDSAELYRCHVT